MQYITVVVDTSALFIPATRAYGVLGVVGYGISGTDNELLRFNKQSDIETEYGAASAIALSTALAFQNGAKDVYCVKAADTAATQQDDTGDGIQTVFDLDFTTDGFACPGSMVVNVNSVLQTEGEDYYIDYGNAQCIFYTPPGDTLAITWDFDAIDAADFVTAIAKLYDASINIVIGAYTYEPALIEDIKDHVTSSSSSGRERIGVVMLPHNNTTGTVETIDITGSGGSIANEKRMVCYGSNSYKDVAAAAAGKICQYEPWISMILKPLEGITQTQAFTSTEETALITMQVNPIVDPELIVGSGLYTGEGYNLGSDASQMYIDIVRTIDDIIFRLKANLTNPAVIGTIKINAAGLRTLTARVRAIMSPRVKVGEIDSFEVNVPLLPLAAIPASERSTEQSAELNTAKAIRNVDVEVSIEYSGAIHGIAITLKFV